MIFDLLNYGFIRNALMAATLTSIACGMIGTYIVSRRLVFISGGISHTSFGGIGIAYFLGIHPLIGAAVFSVLAAFGIEFLAGRSKVRIDSAIAILWSFGMAVGIIFVYITPGYAPNLMSYLFGSILTVSLTEILAMLTVTSLLILFYIFFYRVLLYSSFDEEFARSRGLSVNIVKYVSLAFISLVIVMSIRVAGVILVISLLTIPQAAINLFYRNFRQIILGAVLFAMAGSIGGLVISYWLNIPSGASIIFLLVILFIMARLLSMLRERRKQENILR